jgi:Gas vesicle synthesis protein GvpL/GvpF
MSILLYCIAKREVEASDSLKGVGSSLVLRKECGRLAAFISRDSDSTTWLRPGLRTSAVEFHGVLSNIFKTAAIVPFRFPTLFESDDELVKHLEERSSEYNSWLEKFGAMVQMEIRISDANARLSKGSGTDYLKQRQNAARVTEEFRIELQKALGTLSKGWRESLWKNGLRAFTLIDRDRAAEFETMVRGTQIPNGLSVRVSGPWPVSEFIERDH